MCGARRSNDFGVNSRARSMTHGCAARSSFSPMMAPANCGYGRHSPKTCSRRATGIALRQPSPRSLARHAYYGSRFSRARMTATAMSLPAHDGARHVVDMGPPTLVAMTGPRSLPRPTNRLRRIRIPPRQRRHGAQANHCRARHCRPPRARAAMGASAPRSTVAAPVAILAMSAMVRIRARLASSNMTSRQRAYTMTTGPTEPPRLTRAKRRMVAPPRRPHLSHDRVLPMLQALQRSRTPPLRGGRACSFQHRV